MSLLKIAQPETAEGHVKEVYDFFQKSIGVIPRPMMLFSASPELFKLQVSSMQYFMKHPTLTFALLSSIRYLVSKEYDYAFCTSFNKNFLKMQGMSEEDIAAVAQDPLQAPLEDKERALLGFVMKAIKTPDAVAQTDMDELHAMGWNDRDILDAVTHGTGMIGPSILMKAFKMDQAC